MAEGCRSQRVQDIERLIKDPSTQWHGQDKNAHSLPPPHHGLQRKANLKNNQIVKMQVCCGFLSEKFGLKISSESTFRRRGRPFTSVYPKEWFLKALRYPKVNKQTKIYNRRHHNSILTSKEFRKVSTIIISNSESQNDRIEDKKGLWSKKPAGSYNKWISFIYK